MSSSATNATTGGTAKGESNNGDWLGYGVYADALWSRIETALQKDAIKGDLGDDPLVIGVFGEWGAGQSPQVKPPANHACKLVGNISK